MSFMDEAKATDLVKIIKACKESGVTEIEIGNVKIKFMPSFESFETQPVSVPEWTMPKIEVNTVTADGIAEPENNYFNEDPDLHLINPELWDKQAQMGGQ